MNREDWAQVEAELRNPYGCGALLAADGHSLKLEVQRLKGLRFCIAVFVDGWIRGEHSKRESEIGAKFYRRVEIRAFKRAEVTRMEQQHGKRFATSMLKKYPGTFYFVPYWPSASALRRHLTKTCKDLKLTSCGYVPPAAEGQA